MYPYISDNKNNITKHRIIEYFIANGNTTNADLARELGLSNPTIAKIINEMCEEGWVDEYGKLETDEGRRPNLYGLNVSSAYFIGVDVKRDGLSIGLMNLRGDLIDLRNNLPYQQQNTQESLDELCEQILHFIDNIAVDKDKIQCIGINISGRVNSEKGYSYTIFNFTESSLNSLLSDKLGYSVCIENDSRAMAYGEYLQGCANGEKNVLYVNLRWGLGLGIIIDGKLYRGRSGYAGEFGHIPFFDNDIICHCGKKGCLETEVSGSAFHRIVKERLNAGETTIMQRATDGSFTLDDIITATENEDPLCIDVAEKMGRNLGKAIAGLINLFNPELVIIGGALASTGDYLLHGIKSAVLKFSLNLVNKDTKIVVSKLKDRAGVIGGCMIARQWMLRGGNSSDAIKE